MHFHENTNIAITMKPNRQCIVWREILQYIFIPMVSLRGNVTVVHYSLQMPEFSDMSSIER